MKRPPLLVALGCGCTPGIQTTEQPDMSETNPDSDSDAVDKLAAAGIVYLPASGVDNSADALELEFVAGLKLRTAWNVIEASPGEYDWSVIDGELRRGR